jgi:hypothetical protein
LGEFARDIAPRCLNPYSPFDDQVVTLDFVCQAWASPEEARAYNPYKIPGKVDELRAARKARS